MLKPTDILDEKDSRLRIKSLDVKFPLSKEYKKTMKAMVSYLRDSQIEEIAEEFDLRPGMGLAAPQIGINDRFFVICMEIDEGIFEEHIIINPKIISNSEEEIFVEEGEGCLSVDREVQGIVPRYARIKVKYFDMDGNKQEIRVREDKAIAFQHEIDHLNGILFFDHINKKNPFNNKENMRMI